MREISAEALKEQIEQVAPDWDADLTWDQREDGEVFLAVKKPTVIPLGCGVALLEEVNERICTLSPDYPFSAAMRHRRKFYETSAGIYAQVVKAREKRRAEVEKQIADADHEIAKDVRDLIKDKVQVAVKG